MGDFVAVKDLFVGLEHIGEQKWQKNILLWLGMFMEI
jgi:hypothetical protein